MLHLFRDLLLIISKQLRELLQILLEHTLEILVVPALNAIVVLRKVELLGDGSISLHRLRQNSFHPLLDRSGFRGRVSSAVEKEDILLFWALDVVAQERKEYFQEAHRLLHIIRLRVSVNEGNDDAQVFGLDVIYGCLEHLHVVTIFCRGPNLGLDDHECECNLLFLELRRVELGSPHFQCHVQVA